MNQANHGARARWMLWGTWASISLWGGLVRGAEPATLDFSRDIRPILAEKCIGCHSGEQPKGGLRLGDRTSALGRGESGEVAVVPGKPAASEVVRRIRATDEERMPPADAKQLTAEEMDKLERWIASGAVWTEHWSLRPLVIASPPEVPQSGWARNDIDRFVLAKLAEKGLSPSPEADRATLLKRLSYDLLGLPPSLAEADAFLNDSSPQAYDRLVQRLLDSPHFGERWGRHWLDLAHFADSDGYEKDRARPDAYLYRDWVIQAFNQDLPFDQFTVEQLAGDLLPGATSAQQIATGFLRQTLTNEEGGVDQEEFRIAACFDRAETVGTVWLGLTVGCVRCHDHKYDPLPHTDYYRFFAFFNESEERKVQVPVAADQLAELESRLRPLQERLAARERALAPRVAAWEAAEHRRILSQREGGAKEAVATVRSARSAAGIPLRSERDQVWVETASATAPNAGSTAAATPPTSIPQDDTYTVELAAPDVRVTGFKVTTLPSDRPGTKDKAAGLGPEGNFILTGVKLEVVHGESVRTYELHRPKADFAAPGFDAADVLSAEKSGKKTGTGWSVQGKTGDSHWIQFRTREPIEAPREAVFRLVLEQRHGDQQLLGKFQVQWLIGQERGLYLSNEAIASALEMYPEKRVASTRELLFDHYVTTVERDAELLSLREQIADLNRQQHARLVEVRTMGMPRLSRTTRVFHRGEFLTPQGEVDPGVPGVLPSLQARQPRADRLDLARWLVSPQNYLTPRVAVNHVWLHLFGEGIVRTPSDFGTRGAAPTHPELLDWLAGRFSRELRWSRKELIRLVVSSATYRQASHFRPEVERLDPLNTLIFRQNRFRVESEPIRDLTLAVSGLLSPQVGGPSVFPPMPEDLAKLSYANNFSWTNSSGADRYRRGLYTFFKRTIPHPNLMTFDAPDANVACVRRTVSNTPLQALTLLNNETHAEAAQAFARRVLNTPDLAPTAAVDERLAYALRLCIVRVPEAEEVQSLRRVYERARVFYAAHPDEARQLVGSLAKAAATEAKQPTSDSAAKKGAKNKTAKKKGALKKGAFVPPPGQPAAASPSSTAVDVVAKPATEAPATATSAAEKQTAGSPAVDELAAWTATVRVILNLDEFVTRE